MSDNTSDTTSEAADISGGDIEPSMEDILASIRKIIADDTPKPEETIDFVAPVVDEVPDISIGAQNGQDQAETVEPESAEDILELMNFVDENSTPASAEQESLEIPPLDQAEPEAVLEPVDVEQTTQSKIIEDTQAAAQETIEDEMPSETDEGVVAFDETLDLVMDADASDYVTTTMENENITDEPPEIEAVSPSPLEVKDVPVQETPDVSGTRERDDIDFMDGLMSEDAVIETHQSDTSQDKVGNDEALKEVNVDLDETPVPASTDEDIDLVKSLLVDLMEEPVDPAPDTDVVVDDMLSVVAEETAQDDTVETPSKAQPVTETQNVMEDSFFIGETSTKDSSPALADTPENAESILEEIVEQSVADEISVSESAAALKAAAKEPAEYGAPTDYEPENALERIAKKSKTAAQATPTSDAVDEDVVDLSVGDMGSKLSLLAKVGTIAGAGAAAAAMTKKETEIAAADEAVDIEHILEKQVHQNDSIPADENTSAKEEVIMAQAKQPETLLDKSTQEQSSDAFASLATAVQEKTQKEESGPAIGDLVQEALKPMLKEWLDKNLKGIVERAVTKEVKRISSQK